MYKPLSKEEEEIGKAIVNAAYQIHREFGPGLLEKVYEVCLVHLLRKSGYEVKRQVYLPVHFDGIIFDEGFRLDIIVNDLVVCEIKAIETVNPVWQAQILSHMKLTGKRLGYLINFHTSYIKQGIRRFVK